MRALPLLWALLARSASLTSSCEQLTSEGYAALEGGNTTGSVEIFTVPRGGAAT